MSIFFIKDPQDENTIININANYGYYGSEDSSSLPLGSLNPNYGSKVIDGPETDKALSSGVFSYNNDKSVIARQTSAISTINNNVLKNMGNPSPSPKTYPGQEIFGKEYSYQYIYSNNPNKDRIGVF